MCIDQGMGTTGDPAILTRRIRQGIYIYIYTPAIMSQTVGPSSMGFRNGPRDVGVRRQMIDLLDERAQGRVLYHPTTASRRLNGALRNPRLLRKGSTQAAM